MSLPEAFFSASNFWENFLTGDMTGEVETFLDAEVLPDCSRIF